MLSNDGGDRDAITAALDALDTAHNTVASLSFDTLTHPELLAVLDHLETQRRRHPAVEHRPIARLAAEAAPTELGGKNLAEVLGGGCGLAGRARGASPTPRISLHAGR